MHGVHEKEITKQLLRYRSNLEIVWVVSKPRKDVPIGVRMIVADNMFDCRYEAASAHTWITGLEILDDYFQKRKGQQYIQVKHWSSLTLKVFGPEATQKLFSREENENILNTYKMNADKMDIVLSGSLFDEDSCRKGWSYNGNFVRVGSPRSDVMFRKILKNTFTNILKLMRPLNWQSMRRLLDIPLTGSNRLKALILNESTRH